MVRAMKKVGQGFWGYLLALGLVWGWLVWGWAQPSQSQVEARAAIQEFLIRVKPAQMARVYAAAESSQEKAPDLPDSPQNIDQDAIKEFPIINFGPSGAGLSPTQPSGFPPASPSLAPVASPRPPKLAGQKRSLRLLATGDILTHTSLRVAASLKDGGFDFIPFFEHVTDLFHQGDLVIGNLETPLAGAERGYSGYPQFNAPEELAASLKAVGFTTLVLANNHALDRGWSGLAATINNVQKAGLDYAGAYVDPADKARRLISVYNGILVGVLAYSYGFNGSPGPNKEEDWRLGFIENEGALEDIFEARRRGADFVIVNLHFGQEYQRQPNQSQKDLVGRILEGDPERGLMGADIVLGHHPHMVQPYLVGARRDQDQLVVFSLGNFISNQSKPYTNLGLILDCLLSIDEAGRKAIEAINLIPTACHTLVVDRRKTFRVFPLAMAVDSPSSLSFLSKNELKKMAKHQAEMERHLLSLMEPKPKK
ncbi:MAG: CapA family protein [Deltaproteobacteria bacterium]|jgi:poly-gamma-glutamate synthesis protein (capsule biosynthesis protein)|nr:CapA family protein [Deltaproteobacteria bacterium]